MLIKYFAVSIILKGYFVFGETNHVPQFIDEFEIERIKEEMPIGTHLMKATATDADGDVITYSISDDTEGYFSIDSRTGEVTTAKKIDREELLPESRYSIKFKIVAVELLRPSQKSSQDVTVHVIDVNDNQPTFEKQSYHVNISESKPRDTYVTHVSATDLDNPTELLYKFASGNQDHFFTIDEYQGKIRTAKRLDYETKSNFLLRVEVSDGRPNDPDRLLAYTNVYIDLTDEDDKGAVFSGNYSTTILEGEHKWNVIQNVHAEDGDKGINAPVKYSIEPISNIERFFSIDARTGTVFVNGNIDREKKSVYNLQLLAQEVPNEFSIARHEPGRSTLKVTVEDVNDNSPRFLQKGYLGRVIEHEKKGKIILTVTARDKDVGKNALFEYLLQGAGDAFGISQQGGVFVLAELDREVKYEYDFQVIARQQGRPDSTAKITIIVQDKNDHSPVFTKILYEETITENLSPNIFVTQVSATDKDEGKNAVIEYQILPDAEGNSDCFEIESSSGKIRTRCSLDHEKKEVYLLLIEASDKAPMHEIRKTRTRVKVIVDDVNDNSPVFKELSYNKRVNYDEHIDTQIVKLEATDEDSGKYGEIFYRIVRGNSDSRFHIDSSTGELKVGDSLAAYSGRIMKLSIEAYDNNGQMPSNTSPLVTVTITINKKGANSVVLTMRKKTGSVSANAENIESDLKHILRIGIEVDKIEQASNPDSTNFIFHGYNERTQAVVKKATIVSALESSQSEDMVKFRAKWNVTQFYEQGTAPTLATESDDPKSGSKWHPIIYAVLGFSALIAIFGMIGIIFLIKSKRRNYDDTANSLTSSRIPIAARKQANDMWNDGNFESVSQVGRTEPYIHSSGFLDRSYDRYELDPSNMYGNQDDYRHDPFSVVDDSPSHSSTGSHASSGFAASSVMTVMTAYNPLQSQDRLHPPRNSYSRRSRAHTEHSYLSPRDRKLSVILDDDGKTKTILEDDSPIQTRRPPSYEYDLDEKLADKYDCDV